MKILLMVIIVSVLLGLFFLVLAIQILFKKGHKLPRFNIGGHKVYTKTFKKTENNKVIKKPRLKN
jgi:hypothetical protein